MSTVSTDTGTATDNGVLTASEVVRRLRADVERRGFAWADETVDTFKAGDPDRPVTRIATTWMATAPVLRRAVDLGCDFVVTHEPTFWNHLDEHPRGHADDPTYLAKQAMFDQVTVWRFHDHNHRGFDRDPVFDAFFDRLGWLDVTSAHSLFDAVSTIEPRSLADVAAGIGAALGTRNVRVIGDPAATVTRIGYGGHTLDSCLRVDADVTIVGEVREWDTFEYFRDALALDTGRALIALSHNEVETWGSAPLADWIRDVVPQVDVIDVHADEPFRVIPSA